MKTINSENYFDYAEALHCFLTLWHEGQTSLKYKLLCRSQFKPGPLWSESRVETENDYYAEINEENYKALFNELEQYLEESKEAN